MTNNAVWGCAGCRGTLGSLGCPTHGQPVTFATGGNAEEQIVSVYPSPAAPRPEGLDESGPDLVFSTSPAPEGIDTDCMFFASPDRISVHISRKAINTQVARLSSEPTQPETERSGT
jgi:hypothetical protein